jgi:hypothetical protein
VNVKRIVYIHWKEAEAEEGIRQLRSLGFEVSYEIKMGSPFLRKLRENPPLAVVIDLSRLPSQGRDTGIGIRTQKGTRDIPLLYLGGDPGKVAGIKKILPDAVYTDWERIEEDLKAVIANPPADPVVPESLMAGYRGKPLPVKLGINSDMEISLVNPPPGFERTLGKLPNGVSLRMGADQAGDLNLFFCGSREVLENELKRMVAWADQGPVWIAWPKQSSGVKTDLTQQIVRDAGLGAGLVDYKICSIDKIWSGLLFTRRKT